MPIEKAAAPGAGEAGRFLFEVLCSRLRRLPASDQVTLGFAIQRGAPWGSLAPTVRAAFGEAAGDLGCDS